MDFRVLAAVFITLFATAVGMAHGNIQVDDVTDGLKSLQGAGGGLTDLLKRAGERPSNTSIHADISSPEPFSVSLGSGSRLVVEIGPESRATVADSSISPERATEITIREFTGSLEADAANLSISGTASAVSTGVLSFNYSSLQPVNIVSPEPNVSIVGMESREVVFGNATGTVRSGETEIEVEEQKAVFRYFTGNISVIGDRYVLDGRVYRAVLGDVSIGG
ncbi:MAG: hypothetical protein ABEJ62_00980 [Candidatus Nanohaloarchaea archaeon]